MIYDIYKWYKKPIFYINSYFWYNNLVNNLKIHEIKEKKMSLTLILVILLLIINIQILGLIVVKKLQFSALKVSKNDFEMESVIMRKDYY